MIWLKAIWVNLRAALADFLAAGLMVAIMFALIAVVSAVLFGIGWVINYFFDAAGVLYLILGVLGVFGIVEVACVIAFIRQCYLQVKDTKERLEQLEVYGVE